MDNKNTVHILTSIYYTKASFTIEKYSKMNGFLQETVNSDSICNKIE